MTPPRDESFEVLVTSLLSQLGELPTPENSEQQFINSTVHLYLLHLQQDYTQVTELYSTLDYSPYATSKLYEYTSVSAIKQCAIAGTAYEALNMFSEAIKVYETASRLMNKPELLHALERSPITVPAESAIWLEHLYYRFAMLATSLTWDNRKTTLEALHGYQDAAKFLDNSQTRGTNGSASFQRRLNLLNVYFLYLSAILQQNPDDSVIKEELQRISKSFKATLFNSTAQIKSESSNIPVEQFVDVLFKNWKTSVKFNGPLDLVEPQYVEQTKNFMQTLRQASAKTFHSCAIMRYLVFVLSSLGQYDEALSAFTTYAAYQEKARIRQASSKSSSSDNVQAEEVQTGDDDKSVVNVFAKAIDLIVHVKKDGVLAKDTADKLRSWLNNENLISSRGKGHKRGHERTISSVSSVISADLNDGFGLVWAAIARAYALYALQATTSEERELVYEMAATSYEHSLGYHPSDVQVYFDFALLLAENSQLSRSLKVVRQGLMVDKSHVWLWHLIGLLLSAMEDYDKALQAINNALALLAEKAVKNPSNMLDFEKSQYLQLKMTQVAIHEASDGIDKALELIPEVFTLYGELHPPTHHLEERTEVEAKEEEDEFQVEPNILPTKSRLFIKNLKPGLSLSRTLSRAPFIGSREPTITSAAVPLPRMSTASRVNRPETPSPQDKASRKDLNLLWLWVASLYRRGDLYQDAADALTEAGKSGGLSANGRVELGLLLKSDQPVLALAEFEGALETEKNNTRAIVALAHLIYEQSSQLSTLGDISTEDEEYRNALDEITDELNEVSISSSSHVNGYASHQNGSTSKDISMEMDYYKRNDTKAGETSSNSTPPASNNNTPDNNKATLASSIFISRDDEIAAVTRAQGLLELLLQSGHGFNCSEAWWLMSLIKERNKDWDGATTALWKSVGLEESRGVRNYSILHFEVSDIN